MSIRFRAAVALLLAGLSASSFAQTTGSNGIYDVAVNGTGEYTARTGASHPNPGQNVFYNGAILFPGTTWNSVRSYDSSREWVLRGTAATETAGFTCASLGVAAVTPITDAGGTRTGVHQTWSISDAQDDLEIVQEVNAEGTAFADSVVRVSVCITNRARQDAHVGIRFQWDWQIGGNDGPYIGIRPPYPPTEPFLFLEQDFPSPTWDFYDVSNTQRPTTNPPLYRVGGTVNQPTFSMGPTPPELVQFAAWRGAVDRCFTYATAGGIAGGDDSAVTYYWGATPSTPLVLAPGETWCATQYVFLFNDEPPAFCVINATALGGSVCDAGSVTIDASGSWSTDCTAPLEFRFTDPTGFVQQDWSLTPTCVAAVPGTWVVDVRCSADPTCMTTTRADVIAERHPKLYTASAADLADCNLGVLVTWDPANWQDRSVGGWYDLYRSEVSCADALLQPPLATAIPTESFADGTTLQGRTYYYVLVAEDGLPAQVCTPTGSRGGATVSLCIGPVSDVADPTPPVNVCWPLRVSRQGQQVTLDWTLARALDRGEHVHVLKAVGDPAASFGLACPEAYRSQTWIETDVSSRLQFFDVRFANACEVLSPDDEPPGLDPPRGVPCP